MRRTAAIFWLSLAISAGGLALSVHGARGSEVVDLAAAAPAGYLVEDLGALAGDAASVAWAINAGGDVVGWSTGAEGTRAFVFRDGAGMAALPGLPGRPRTVARDINDAGDVVGGASAGGADLGHAALWSGGSVRDLGTLGNGLSSEALGVNNLGQVVGWSATDGGSLGAHAFLAAGAGLVDLTPASDTGYATDINDAGQVTGYRTAPGGYHAFRWQGGEFVDLGALPGFAHSFGWAINAAGQVAGSSSTASGNRERLIRSAASGLQDLGGAGEHNIALGINALGQVVGVSGNSLKRALLYTDAAGLRDLNTLIDRSLGWVLLAANDINDAGQIAGYAFNNFTRQTHAVRLQLTATLPGCSFHCLRAVAIQLQARVKRGSRVVTGRVTIQDENGAPVPTALVVAAWTQPDGSTRDGNAWTGANGVATFATSGPRGSYTLRIMNIVRSLYTFDPGRSVLARSLNVPR